MIYEFSYRSDNASLNESAGGNPPELPAVGGIKTFNQPGMRGCFRVQRVQDPVHLSGKTTYVIELARLKAMN
jgi:hypothetical protein